MYKRQVEDDIQMPEDKSPFGTYLLIALVAVGAAAGGYLSLIHISEGGKTKA